MSERRYYISSQQGLLYKHKRTHSLYSIIFVGRMCLRKSRYHRYLPNAWQRLRESRSLTQTEIVSKLLSSRIFVSCIHIYVYVCGYSHTIPFLFLYSTPHFLSPWSCKLRFCQYFLGTCGWLQIIALPSRRVFDKCLLNMNIGRRKLEHHEKTWA